MQDVPGWSLTVHWVAAGAGSRSLGRQSVPSPEEAAWAAAETDRILDSLPLPSTESAERVAKAIAKMRQPLLDHLSRTRYRAGPDGHLQWAADIEQLLHMLLGLEWSLAKLTSFVGRGRTALTQNAAGVRLRLDFLQHEGGLTAEEAAKAFGSGFSHSIGKISISSLQRGLEQLQATGLNADRVRSVLKQNCQVLTATPSLLREKLDCLRGARVCCSVVRSLYLCTSPAALACLPS